MKRLHEMPFGSRILPGGRTRFRLWAPNVSRVDLCLDPEIEDRIRPMRLLEDGWFELDVEGLSPGCRYGFRLPDGLEVPDPASRFQPEDVHRPSELVNPEAYVWSDGSWTGRAWEETVFYELHVGTFTAEGTFSAVQRHLDDLVDLGATAIELMPVADFPGERNWGYDGVLPFAPDARYGRPEDLKALVDAAHARGLMVFLDVVFNHLGPDGNYLWVYARPYFDESRQTPWGPAINFSGPHHRTVRDFFVHNALYWLEEFHLDGLRIDAAHAIIEDRSPGFLEELAERAASMAGKRRHVHLVIENDRNESRLLARDGPSVRHYTAQWNDDLHHALHVLATSEVEGYYEDYREAPLRHLGRALAEGFAFQGEASGYRGGRPRGEPSGHLPPTAFVVFLQNHDQIGNRALGERIRSLVDTVPLRALYAAVLLSPSIPLLFMGEEWGSRTPFPFFCDLSSQLAPAITAGRRQEFAKFPAFSSPEAQRRIPDPCALSTFRSAILDREEQASEEGKAMLAFVRSLLSLRRREIVPLLASMPCGMTRWRVVDDQGLEVVWPLNGGAGLVLAANLSESPLTGLGPNRASELLFATHPVDAAEAPPWSVRWWKTRQA